MTDYMTPAQRSAMMSRIRGKDTTPELQVRKGLWHAGFRYRMHDRRLPGRPDIVLPRWRAVIFVHGCFWHAHHGCAAFRLPSTRPEFWREKIESNRVRDEKAVHQLLRVGWRVSVVWECAVRAQPERVTERLIAWVRNSTEPFLALASE
jgi:DNA mismatch endonuclease (patch repair protein)